MQNVIERKVIINAKQEQVYEAIANPEQVVLWFPETLEGDYQVGEQPIFGFGENGTSQIYVVAAKPYHYFAYRWVPGASNFLGDVRQVPNTLVEFRIEEEAGNRCKVVLTESGFAELPTELMESAFKQNSSGWDFMLNRLTNHFEAE